MEITHSSIISRNQRAMINLEFIFNHMILLTQIKYSQLLRFEASCL
jgi:hypothetical protein